ncbi:AAA family ATPase [Nocardia sp. NPDC057227]|uniref:AAA family ATPase n=1 Tax=Nocardia sp. NPDC057227 TaxID=3346056 RepID=UPI00363B69EE
MQIRAVWIRFYKSFNLDYELKANPEARTKSAPWQQTPHGWMPHIRIPLEGDITAVVGANESGKTHLIDAVKLLLTGQEHHQRDFCRSSSLFSVEQDARLFPEVAATLALDPEDERRLLGVTIPRLNNGDILMIRPEPKIVQVVNAQGERSNLSMDVAAKLEALLPFPHQLKTSVALPDSVSIAALSGSVAMVAGRRTRSTVLSKLLSFGTADTANKRAGELLDLLATSDSEHTEAQNLGMALLLDIARIERSSFAELQAAIADEREGLVNGLIQEMNNSIARHLNVSRWWSQDPQFQLRVSPREHELVFTIRDRTGTDYSFSERSRGLRYFLSYYVQLLSHERPADRPEVLLMDEPDAYLSASGQQDLLRILEHFAYPEDSDRAEQIVYVTHSPFLINRNAGHRVRVLDKGSRDEGTRLVKDATRNHYEPLRTSLGAFVAETAFIGGDNLFVEGIADQVLIAGMNARLLRAGTPPSRCLDLNQVTIVPGGANIPYMLYLARGRDQVRPACVVLLDGDDAGQTARKQIRRGGAHRKPTVADDLIVLVSEWAEQHSLEVTGGVVVREPEDLVPVGVAVPVARRYARTFLGYLDEDTKRLTEQSVIERIPALNGSLWDALQEAFESAFGTTIGKAGFAKELLGYLKDSQSQGGPRPAGVPALDNNFAVLIEQLALTLRRARERETDDRRDNRLERIIDTFIADQPAGCSRDLAALTLARIDAAVDDTAAGDVVRAGTARIRRNFKLATEPLKKVEDFAGFIEALSNLRHLERLRDQGLIGSTTLSHSKYPAAGRAKPE